MTGCARKTKPATLTAHERFCVTSGSLHRPYDIREFIAEDNPNAADRVITEIFDTLRALPPFPHQGHRRPDLTSRPLRFKLVRDYLIAYAPDESPLWVIAVLHGRRSPRVMAAILRDRESR